MLYTTGKLNLLTTSLESQHSKFKVFMTFFIFSFNLHAPDVNMTQKKSK